MRLKQGFDWGFDGKKPIWDSCPTNALQDWPAVSKRIEDFPKTERDVLHHGQLLSFIMSYLVKGFALVSCLGL